MEKLKPYRYQRIKGSALNELGITFVKITNDAMCHHKLQLFVGENKDIYNLTNVTCAAGGIYFCPADIMHNFREFGNGYHIVTVADDEDIFVEDFKCKAQKITLSQKYFFQDTNKEAIKRLVCLNGLMLAVVKYEFKNDIDICKIAVSQNGLAIQHVLDRCRNNLEICKLAIQSNINSYQYILIDIGRHPDFCKFALSHHGSLFCIMSESDQDNDEICAIAIKNNWRNMQYVSKRLRRNMDFCKLATEIHFDTLQYVSHIISNSDEICNFIMENYKTREFDIRHIPKKIKYNFDLCKYAVTQNPACFEFLNAEMRGNEEIAKIAMALDGMLLGFATRSIRCNKEICKIAVSNDINSMRYIDREFSYNPEINSIIIDLYEEHGCFPIITPIIAESLRFWKIALKNNHLAHIKMLQYNNEKHVKICKSIIAECPDAIKYLSIKMAAMVKHGERRSPNPLA